jgi:RND family efflux transporter MFP subunit
MVQLQEVESRTVQNFSEFVGSLEARNKVALRPELSGRITQIFVQPGQSVQAGTPIAQLQADQTRSQLGGAVADVEASAAAVNTAQARIRAAEASRDRARADVQLQDTELRRTQELVAEGALAQQSLDQVTNERATAVAALAEAEGNLGAVQAALTEAQALLNSSRADQAVASEDLQDRLIVAPIAGVVGEVPSKVGDFVSSDDAITNIIQNEVLELNIAVPIERATDLRVGLPIELLDATGEPFIRGRISFVSPEVTANQQSVLAKATFENDGLLKDGQFVRTRLIWSAEPGVLVPSVAVTRVAGQTFVFVAETGEESTPDGQPQQIARQRPVTLGNLQGNNYEVISGLETGEQVIVTGVLNLQDGSPIMMEQAMLQP